MSLVSNSTFTARVEHHLSLSLLRLTRVSLQADPGVHLRRFMHIGPDMYNAPRRVVGVMGRFNCFLLRPLQL